MVFTLFFSLIAVPCIPPLFPGFQRGGMYEYSSSVNVEPLNLTSTTPTHSH